MIVPLAAPHRDAVPPVQPELPPGAEQLLPPPPQELLQINGVGPLLLFIGKMDNTEIPRRIAKAGGYK